MHLFVFSNDFLQSLLQSRPSQGWLLIFVTVLTLCGFSGSNNIYLGPVVGIVGNEILALIFNMRAACAGTFQSLQSVA